jgi:hypothetical protein
LVLAAGAGEKAVRAVLLPPIGTEIDQIARLKLQDGSKRDLKAIVAGWEAALKAVERKPVLIMGFGEGPFTRPDKLAATFGFKDCAQAL